MKKNCLATESDKNINDQINEHFYEDNDEDSEEEGTPTEQEYEAQMKHEERKLQSQATDAQDGPAVDDEQMLDIAEKTISQLAQVFLEQDQTVEGAFGQADAVAVVDQYEG